MRPIALILLAVAALAAVLDRVEGGAASLAERWAALHRPSLIGLQSGLENRVHPDAFFDWALPVLELPAAASFGVLGAALLALSLLRSLGRRSRSRA